MLAFEHFGCSFIFSLLLKIDDNRVTFFILPVRIIRNMFFKPFFPETTRGQPQCYSGDTEIRFTLQNAPRLSRAPISAPRRGSNISTHKFCVKDITYIERLDTDCHILTASSLLDQPHGCVICPIPYKASIPFKEPRANVHFYQINNLSRFDFTFTLGDVQQMVDGDDVSMRDFRTVSR